MIYICIPTYNETATIGLLLWRIRQVFSGISREYELLLADDGSTDGTSEHLEPYSRALPLTIVRHETRLGTAASVEALLRLADRRTDRPKRDAAIVMHADFAHSPTLLPDFARATEGGADLVVAEAEFEGAPTTGHARFRRWAPRLLRQSVRVPGVKDVASAYVGIRLVALRQALRATEGPLLTQQGWAAHAELQARIAPHARKIETIQGVERYDMRRRESRLAPWPEMMGLWRARTALRAIPRIPIEATPARASAPSAAAS